MNPNAGKGRRACSFLHLGWLGARRPDASGHIAYGDPIEEIPRTARELEADPIVVAHGISLVATLLTRETQLAWRVLGAHVSQFNHPAWSECLRSLGLSPTDPKAIALIASQITQQAGIIAIIDVFGSASAIK